MKDLNCPYCNAELEVCHDDGQGYEEEVNHQMQCYKCRKNFVFQTSISFHYEPFKADCLNGEEHKFERTITAPIEFSKMRCEYCGEEREMTKEERLLFGIRTKDEYFKELAPRKSKL